MSRKKTRTIALPAGLAAAVVIAIGVGDSRRQVTGPLP